MMLTQIPTTNRTADKADRSLRRTVALNASLGTVGLGAASLLIYPKIAAIMAGGVASFGLGLVANLALVFGSLMFLREAQRARAGRQPSRVTRDPA